MIFLWWKTNRRDLPWRHTHDPYHIAVSEIMLQQTQVSRVIPKYIQFLDSFPDIKTLAGATPARVIRAWKGMGYNRRALYLHSMAKIVVGTYKGIIPENEKLLIKLPGLGKYTARAILVFAYRKNISCVDTNICKIMTHFFFSGKQQKPSVIQDIADRLVPAGKSWEWHQALMDYGAAHDKDLRIKDKELSKNKVPFRQTNRYYRGRIMDLLRESHYQADEFIMLLKSRFGKTKLFYRKLLGDLQKEGLVTIQKKIISLPLD
jgi:A/G-specific adenine glycosylase